MTDEQQIYHQELLLQGLLLLSRMSIPRHQDLLRCCLHPLLHCHLHPCLLVLWFENGTPAQIVKILDNQTLLEQSYLLAKQIPKNNLFLSITDYLV